jgi:hypothetical protein
MYAQWVEREVLPRAEKTAGVRLTRNPDGRATMGISSSGAAAFTMAWFHPELYRRVLAYSPTLVNQQWPQNPALRGGAWEYHSAYTGRIGPYLNVDGFNLPTPTDVPPGSPLIANSPRKPIRFWFETGDQDLFYTIVSMADGMHDRVLANGFCAINRSSLFPRALRRCPCHRVRGNDHRREDPARDGWPFAPGYSRTRMPHSGRLRRMPANLTGRLSERPCRTIARQGSPSQPESHFTKSAPALQAAAS